MTAQSPLSDPPTLRRAAALGRAIVVVATVAALLVAFGTLLGGSTAPLTAVGNEGPTATVAFASFPDASFPDASLQPIGTPGTSPEPSATPAPTCPAPPSGIAAAALKSHGARTRKVVALTFDDGWNPANVLKILGILEHARVNATFFPIGRVIELYPAAWKAVAAAHFPIANHTYDHRRLTDLCYPAQLAEMTRQDGVVSSDLDLMPLPFMRPPYDAFNRATRIAATAAGKQDLVLWDVDTLDWTGLSAQAISNRALAGRDGSIVLMHTFPVNTSAALPSIIARYRARGFTFVTIGTLLGLPGPVPFH